VCEGRHYKFWVASFAILVLLRRVFDPKQCQREFRLTSVLILLIEVRPGNQHNRATGPSSEETKQSTTGYTPQELAVLSARLEKQLGPEYISSRQGPGGGKVHYIAAEKCINLANEVFGFNGWSSSIRDIQVDFVDENPQTGKVSLGLSVIMRVTVKDGAYHEDIGYGQIENCKGKAAAFEKAKKEGTTDALKRTLRNFGNVLGNCLYDKEYLGRVSRMKAGPSKWDVDSLHRHSEFVQVKQEPSGLSAEQALKPTDTNDSSLADIDFEMDADFVATDFDEADFNFSTLDQPDEGNLKPRNPLAQGPTSAATPAMEFQGQSKGPQQNPQNPQVNGRPVSVPVSVSRPPLQQPPGQPRPNMLQSGPPMTNSRPTNVPNANGFNHQANNRAVPPLPHGQQGQRPQQNHSLCPPHPPTSLNDNAARPTPGPQRAPSMPIEGPIPQGVPSGFLSAKAAEVYQNPGKTLTNLPQFNPHAESPSIKRTPGIDHSKSGKVHTDVLEPLIGAVQRPAGAANAASPPARNALADQARRIGMPQGMASPLANRGQFRPVKRAAEGPPQQ